MCYNVWPQTPGMLKSERKCESQKAVPLGRWLGQCPVTAQNVTTVVPLLVHKVSKAPLFSKFHPGPVVQKPYVKVKVPNPTEPMSL